MFSYDYRKSKNKNDYYQSQLRYVQNFTKALEKECESICCGRITGQIFAYRRNGEQWIMYSVYDEDDYYLDGTIQCYSEEQFQRVFRELVNVYNDYKYYKVWNLLSFFNIITNEARYIIDKGQHIEC